MWAGNQKTKKTISTPACSPVELHKGKLSGGNLQFSAVHALV